MKSLFLLVVLGLFIFSCTVDDKVGDNSSEVSEVRTFTAFVVYGGYSGYKGRRPIKEPTSKEACKLDLKMFLEKNIEFFKTNSTDVQVCCMQSESNGISDFCINDKDFVLFKGPKSPVYYKLYRY